MNSHQTINMGYTSYNISIVPGKSIMVQRKDELPKKFSIGDEAEYDSYNLKYTGNIVSITEKTVTIKPKYENKNRRLKIDTFSWRNWNFDSEKVAAENSDTMNYI
jgi:hypothetical protein